MKLKSTMWFLCSVLCGACVNSSGGSLDSRIEELVYGLSESALKTQLLACADEPVRLTDFSISHRGAPLGYAEHTREGYQAAAKMGAGYIECDVTFTKDRALVCRHSQCDLHTTTNILETELAGRCTSPPDPSSETPFSDVMCCTSDITVAEYKSLTGRMDAGNKDAKSVEEYLEARPDYRPELKAATGSLMTHRESIELFKSLGVKMIPELKQSRVPMPFEGEFTQTQYAQALVDDYFAAGVQPDDVVLQSFNRDDLLYWLEAAPEFGQNAAWLDGRYRDDDFDIGNSESWNPSMAELRASGITNLASPLWMLLDVDQNNLIVASDYAKAAKAAGLNLIAWTLERSGSLTEGGGWYYQTIESAISANSDVFRVLQALDVDVGVSGVFSDWPATVSYYANCFDL